MAAPSTSCYEQNADGIWVPPSPVEHHDEEYDPAGFDLLLQMQSRHFWYLGRHRFLLAALRRELRRHGGLSSACSAIDLGGGTGGWVKYLNENAAELFAELALGDSSRRGLEMAAGVVGPATPRYQIDLLNLHWSDRWDVAFLLDVLEHIPDDVAALREIQRALRPGGLLLVTTPALHFFWSYNDAAAGHQRRYSRRDFARLAEQVGLELCDARYFMFFLSPLLLLRRLRRVQAEGQTAAEAHEYLRRTHHVPAAPLNQLLRLLFSAETPLGLHCRFPWGTSLLGVFRKPERSS